MRIRCSGRTGIGMVEGMAGIESDIFVLAQASGCLVVLFTEMGKTQFGFAWSFI